MMNAINPTPLTNNRLNALLFLGTILLFIPTWLWLAQAWWSDPYYSHGPLVLLIALYFAWVQRHVTPALACGASVASRVAAKQSPSDWGLLVVALALVVHLWAMVWRAYYISALMLPVTILGLLIALYGWQIARRFWFPLAFLVLMIPLPIAERFGPPLESFAAMSATTLAQWLGIAARNDGAQVFLPNSTFTVGIPCGGLRSIIAIITLVVLLAYITEGRVWARLLVLLAAIPIALAANTLRITLLFAVANVWGEGAGLEYFHTWSSPVLFLCAFALVLALAKLVGCSQVRWQAVLPG